MPENGKVGKLSTDSEKSGKKEKNLESKTSLSRYYIQDAAFNKNGINRKNFRKNQANIVYYHNELCKKYLFFKVHCQGTKLKTAISYGMN